MRHILPTGHHGKVTRDFYCWPPMQSFQILPCQCTPRQSGTRTRHTWQPHRKISVVAFRVFMMFSFGCHVSFHSSSRHKMFLEPRHGLVRLAHFLTSCVASMMKHTKVAQMIWLDGSMRHLRRQTLLKRAPDLV